MLKTAGASRSSRVVTRSRTERQTGLWFLAMSPSSQKSDTRRPETGDDSWSSHPTPGVSLAGGFSKYSCAFWRMSGGKAAAHVFRGGTAERLLGRGLAPPRFTHGFSHSGF